MDKIQEFLERLKHTNREDIHFVNRKDPANKEAESYYRWTVDDKIDIILSLTYEDALKSPEPDDKFPEEKTVYFFKSALRCGYDSLYIKITERKGGPIKTVISLHIPRWNM